MTYQAKHLGSGECIDRPSVLINNSKKDEDWHYAINPAVEAFHRTFPQYGETQLHDLPALAEELGLGRVFVKDESSRFGLPSFKVLGASWAIHRAICRYIGMEEQSDQLSLADLDERLHVGERVELRLITCTEGNWGRAAARVANHLDMPITIYVPGFMQEATLKLILREGGEVEQLDNGTYDDAVAAAKKDAEEEGTLLVMDVSWDGYEEIPQWVTEGYTTMLLEADRQVAAQSQGKKPDVVIASVGVGSWAHAVAAHYRALYPDSKVITVEPDTAACFKESLHCGQPTSIATDDTIMAGMNCGTVSKIAWPVLRDGAFAAVAVSDQESHECVQYLQSQHVNAGPCGAATLAALKKICAEKALGDADAMKDLTVVLFSTEGKRDYKVPN